MGIDHKCPDDPLREMFHVMLDEDDGEGPYDAGCWGLACCPSVEFHWDQWMRCTIICLHGRVAGVACGVNFIESFTRAVEQFNAYDHSQPYGAKRDDEDYTEFFARCERRPYDTARTNLT